MKKHLLTAVVLFALISSCYAQEKASWNEWNWLLGQWKGEGSGEPGQGGGTFSFTLELDKQIIIRKSHSEYPPTQDKPMAIHEALLIVYLETAGNPPKAIYFDNEGHIIHYAVSYANKAITFVSERTNNTPAFRLIYTMQDSDTVHTKFEMSQDGQHFMTYIEGNSSKIMNN